MKPTSWFRLGSRASSAEVPVSQSGSHVTGNDSRLMRDLENDCVDRDIYDEEIRSRQNQEPTCRGQTLRILDSNPLQVLLYFLVLLDAGVVIAEILIDLHAMRYEYGKATSDLELAAAFLKTTHASYLEGYVGNDIHKIIERLNQKLYAIGTPETASNTDTQSPPTSFKRDVINVQDPVGHRSSAVRDDDQLLPAAVGENSVVLMTSTTDIRRDAVIERRPRSINAVHWGSRSRSNDAVEISENEKDGDIDKADKNVVVRVRYGERLAKDVAYKSQWLNETGNNDDVLMTSSTPLSSHEDGPKHASYAQRLLKIAHLLHYVGIGILAFFVVQVLLKVFGMGKEFFKKKLEMFDAVIVLTSFSLDLVFIEGITGPKSEEAIALLIIFLLWRILRIINGIIVTAQKRQDLRIQLQKRARRRAEKKIEYLEDDKNWKEREISNLRRLCSERGASEDEIAQCKPRRRTIFQKMDTSLGLSSIATLSLGLSMSMAGAGRAVMRSLGPGHQQALQQFFPILPTVIQAERARARSSPSSQIAGSWIARHRARNAASSTAAVAAAATANQNCKSNDAKPPTTSDVKVTTVGGADKSQDPAVSSSNTDHLKNAPDCDAAVKPITSRFPQNSNTFLKRHHQLTAAYPVDLLHSIVPDVIIHAASDAQSFATTPLPTDSIEVSTGKHNASSEDVVQQSQLSDPNSSQQRRMNRLHQHPKATFGIDKDNGINNCLRTSGASSSSLPQLSLTNKGTGSCIVGGSHVLLNDVRSNNLSLGALHAVGPEAMTSNLTRARVACRPCHDLSTAVAASAERPQFVVGHSGRSFQHSRFANGGSPNVVSSSSSSSSPCFEHDRAMLLQNEVSIAMTSLRNSARYGTMSRDRASSTHSDGGSSLSLLSDVSIKSVSTRGSGCSVAVAHLVPTSAGSGVSSSLVRGASRSSSSAVRGRLAVVSGTKAWWSKSDETPSSSTLTRCCRVTENWNEGFGGAVTSPVSGENGLLNATVGRRSSAQDEMIGLDRATTFNSLES